MQREIALANLKMPMSKKKDQVPQVTALDVLQRFRLIIRAAQSHSAEIERTMGIPSTQVWVLLELNENGSMRAGELAAHMALKPATLSNMLNRMEAAGLVERVRSKEDLRIVMVALTAEGKEKAAHVPQAGRGWLPEALAKLDNTELSHLAEGLDALIATMPSQDESERYQPLPFAE